MKKLILFLLIGALLLLPLSGCFADNQQNEGTTPANTTENTTPEGTMPEETTPEATTPEVTTPDNPPEATTPPEVTTPDNPPVDTPTYERSQELDAVFTLIEQDKLENNKISLYICDEEYYFELKNAGLYPNSPWIDAYFEVIVHCHYPSAVNEAWYKQVSQKDTKSLNEAFYNSCKDSFSDGAFSNISFYDGLYFTYSTPEDFLVDYDALKSLLDLPYVVCLEIVYYYPVPINFGDS